jgi:hypothetical protein
MNEDQRNALIYEYVTKTIDEMTLGEIIGAYAEDVFDHLSTWSDAELEGLE